jgi:CheY-like chemotaxis protein
MGFTILYVEDHATVRLALKETLEREGWHVEACADGVSALARLEGGEAYALLVFDNDLPGIDGIELTRRARSFTHRRSTPVVIVSASEVRAEAREAGADVFLRKPQDVGLLVATAKELVRREG